MGSTSRPFFSNQKPTFPLFLLLLCLTLTLLIHTTTYNLHPDDRPITLTRHFFLPIKPPPRWYKQLRYLIDNHSRKLHMGLVNVQSDEILVDGSADLTEITYEKVRGDTRWEDLFPEWVDEDGKWGRMKCPEIPMPGWSGRRVDVVVARVPEGGNGREVGRLQVNLVVANVLVNGGWDEDVYVVFIGRSGAMWEIFRCDDMVWEDGEYKIYKPDLKRLMEKVKMPVGSCIINNPSPGQDLGRSDARLLVYEPREAYVTVLHSSETYVCGAIALAQSIQQTNSTKDLVLLADDSISRKSLEGLKAAGWKIKTIQRIRSPHARKGAYNEYNYSKLRIWQLIQYDKVMFIDADLIVLKNLDEFFRYPQISAVGNDKYLFNSGLILVEPSQCMFNGLMEKIDSLGSYNGGDQGFLNEAFTWWHRLHSKVNHLKIFQDEKGNSRHEMRGDLYTIHYLGLKPWMCYKDYDCNWDKGDHRQFASDFGHKKWWKVYEGMSSRLKGFCGLTKEMDGRIRKWRKIARSEGFRDGHWKIKVKDRRQVLFHGIML